MKKLYIIGAGGFGREVIWLVERINTVGKEWEIAGFIDDNASVQGSLLNGYKVLGGCDYFDETQEECWVVCCIGSAGIRKMVVEKLMQHSNVKFAKLIDPSVLISDLVEIGEGSIICAGTIATVNISIGKHVIINLDCTIGHDVILKDFVTIYPSVNVSGNVVVGECAELGTGTQIIQGKNIGDSTIVGAGAVVTKDLPENCTAVGAPAKPIKFHE